MRFTKAFLNKYAGFETSSMETADGWVYRITLVNKVWWKFNRRLSYKGVISERIKRPTAMYPGTGYLTIYEQPTDYREDVALLTEHYTDKEE